MFNESSFEVEPSPSISTQEMKRLWIAQEGLRYKQLITDRGYLRSEDGEDTSVVLAATTEWRETFIDDLDIKDATWAKETIEQPAKQAKEWFLGGFRSWHCYRPAGAGKTRFGDVIEAITSNATNVREDHKKFIPEKAETINEAFKKNFVFLFRCGTDIAVLEGTHRVTELAYAGVMGMATPEKIDNVYVCDLSEDKRDAFDRFCKDRPVVMGKYYQEKKSE